MKGVTRPTIRLCEDHDLVLPSGTITGWRIFDDQGSCRRICALAVHACEEGGFSLRSA
ncbi:hypothetical protein MPC4_60117 [Methylocella tundrae]|uniref:Uncharacterized protein n=1 Tax=Methylocella tundrae TaxID=227605 RepID=A0A8B6MCT3_METTU|nr:hypothetical protein MPC4_60117 [Methylocella tundrae]